MIVSMYYMLFPIIRPHRRTTYVDAAYCYRLSSEVCLSVRLSVTIVSNANAKQQNG